MRLSFVVRSVNAWFGRVVYERDSWDQALNEWSEDSGYGSIIAMLVRICVALTRAILWVFMMVGHLISHFMLRRMEFDADRSQSRLVGVRTFEKTFRRLALLDAAAEEAAEIVAGCYSNDRYPDDFAALVVGLADTMSTVRSPAGARGTGGRPHRVIRHASVVLGSVGECGARESSRRHRSRLAGISPVPHSAKADRGGIPRPLQSHVRPRHPANAATGRRLLERAGDVSEMWARGVVRSSVTARCHGAPLPQWLRHAKRDQECQPPNTPGLCPSACCEIVPQAARTEKGPAESECHPGREP